MRRILLTMGLSFLILLSFAQNQSIDQIFDGRTEIYFQFAASDLPLLENGESKCLISIDKVENSIVYAYASKPQFADFLNRNIPYQKLTTPSMLLSPADLNMLDWQDLSNRSTQAWDYYPTYSAYVSLMQGFANSYPSIYRLDTIGYTVEGRLLLAAVISDNVNTDENEPEFFYSGTMHGDETAGYVLMLHLIDYLLTNYGVDSRVTNMVNNVEIYINPAANPDGTYAGGNTTIIGATRANANGEDLNRNYPVPNGNIGDDNTYYVEIENQAMIEYALSHDFVMSANFHGGAELLNYPWDYQYTDHADHSWWIYVSKEYADTAQNNSPSGYLDDNNAGSDYPGVIEGATWYSVDGSRQDYYQYFGHCREVTIECSSTKNPAASTLEPYWDYNYRSLLNYIEQSLYGIRGIVTDSCTGLPIRALVSISSHDLDSSQVYSSLPVGNYHRPIAPGTWTMTVSANGYQTKTINGITTSYGNTVVQDVILVADPPSADFIADAVSSCSGLINFTNTGSYSQGSAFYWDFGDGNTSTQENPTHVYAANGTYNVKLSVYACAGADSITKNSYITINMPAAPIADNDTICGSGSLLLGATGGSGTTMWYDSYPGGTLLDTGATYTTPVIGTTTTYYAVSEVGTAYTGAKTNKGTTGGYYSNSLQQGLIFDCTSPVRLTSVKMYAGSAGNRTFTLQNSSGGTIDQVTVNVPTGESVVTLNIDIPVGTNMRLMGPGAPDLWRDGSTVSANLPYPYTVGSMISITNSTASSNSLHYYYYFYDWTVEEICESNAVPVTAEVLSDPIASFSHSVSGPLVDFTNTGSTGMIYSWDFGDGNTSTQENPSYTYSSAGTFTVVLIVDNGYCSDTTSALISIGSGPNAAFSADTVCLSSTTAFTDLSSIASGSIVGWDWSFGDGTGTSTAQNPTYTYPDTGAYLVELIVESNLGLYDTTTVNVYVTTSPNTDFSFVAGIAGSSTAFTDLTQSSLFPVNSWLWDFGDGGTSTQQNPSYTYTVSGTYTVCLTTTNSCGTDSSCASISIATAATPNASFSADTVCLGTATNFQDESTIAAGSIIGWDWDFGDGSGTASSQNPTYIYPDTGAYQVALTVLSNGGTNDIAYSTVYVTTRPLADFSYIAGYAGAATSFTDLSQSYILPLTGWNWSFGDGNTATIQNPTNVYLNPGLFGITLVSYNSCGSDTATNQINVITTQIEEYGEGMIIYPNPVNNDFMNISFFAVEAGNCNYSIFSSDGRLVLAEELNCENGLNTIRVDVSALEKSLYLIEMRAGEKIYRMQFLK